MNISKAVKKLIMKAGTQQKLAAALKVSQPTVSAWLTGKHNMSAIVALRAEKLTGGEIKAVWLCPELAEVDG